MTPPTAVYGRIAAGLVLAGAALVWLLWVPPFSPIALSRADALVGLGEPHAAVDRYDAIAESGWSEQAQQRALERGAMVWAVELGRPAEARSRLERLLERELPVTKRARLLTEIGRLHLEVRQLEEAAGAFEAAYRAAPEATGAARRLRTAARLLAEREQTEKARALWTEVTAAFPGEAALAKVGLAEIALREGDAQTALGLYEEAEESTFDSSLQALARLGAATCLERLGDLDQALAELDELDLPDPVLDMRREGIRARRDVRE